MEMERLVLQITKSPFLGGATFSEPKEGDYSDPSQEERVPRGMAALSAASRVQPIQLGSPRPS